MPFYLTNEWANLSRSEQDAVSNRAEEAQDKANHTICLWCGEPFYNGEYDFIGSKPNQREICKNYCKGIRFFDMPKQASGPTAHPLSSHPVVFVGSEPIAVMFGSERVPATSWKEVYRVILQHCVQDFTCYERLLALKRSISTQEKPFLSSKFNEMACPVEICEDLYAETDYSFHILFHLLTERILKPIKFSVHNIRIIME
ncbi:MAG: hypothetical protein FWC66_10000 [Oscillospiraceae bacterium]|nr:hypothetical protein [Oscillospiraceae bacterium]